MKKIISLILCLTLMFSLAVPAFAAPEELPTIYITGAQTNNLFSADGERIYPLDVDATALLKESLGPCLEELALGYLMGDYEQYAEKLYSYVAPVFEKVMLDGNGEATDGSRPEYHSSTVSVSNKQSGYGMWDYRFWYDWRLSPVVTAEELKDYIDRVLEATGKDKVQLVGRCYGANVIQAYITLHKDHALEYVSDVAYYASSVDGIDFMSALLSGDVTLNDKAVSNFVEYYIEHEELIEDNELSLLIYTLVELFQQVSVLGLGTEALEDLFNTLKADLVPRLVRAIIGTWPSYWAMVTEDKYKQSRDFIFGDCKEEYAGLIEKTDKYYYDVQLCTEETITELQAKGINFYIFSKYGFPEFPLHEDALLQSDSYTTVTRQSFGAITANYGEVLSDEYIAGLTDTKYLSPDYKIDASTCLLPERSWFINNLHHNNFEVLHNMTLEIMRYDLTVDNEEYPQYIYHENNVLTPITAPDEDNSKPADNPLASLMRFLTAFFNMIAKIFRGEFEFSFGK